MSGSQVQGLVSAFPWVFVSGFYSKGAAINAIQETESLPRLNWSRAPQSWTCAIKSTARGKYAFRKDGKPERSAAQSQRRRLVSKCILHGALITIADIDGVRWRSGCCGARIWVRMCRVGTMQCT